jgi:hypothetical protein
MIAHSGARARRQHKSAQREFLCNSAAEATAISKGYVAIQTDRQTDRQTDIQTDTHRHTYLKLPYNFLLPYLEKILQTCYKVAKISKVF